jgi:hypothetical protein
MFRLNIKSLLLIAGLVLLPLCLDAQDKGMSTLFGGNKDIRYGGYGAFEARLTQLDGSLSGFLLGGRGGVILDEVFSFGGAGYGFIPVAKIDCPIPGHENEKNNFWTGGYGGLFFEYINSSNSLVHLTANVLIGAGGITYLSHNNTNNRNSAHPISVSFVLEPGIGIELNVMKNFRMYLGASYRYAPNFEFQYQDEYGKTQDVVPNTAFNGISINLGFKFGSFKGHTKE